MKNIMLVFPYKVTNDIEFNNIIDEFDRKDYYIHIFNGLENQEFDITILSSIISQLKNQYNDINKIIVLSNVKEIIFSWYRCYNSLIDEFIYFIDNEEKNIIKDNDMYYKLVHKLSKFNSIETERIEGKIYLNINLDNYLQIYDFIVDNKVKYFDDIKNIKCFDKIYKAPIKKRYIFEKHEFKFNYESTYNLIDETIELEDNNNLKNNKELINQLKNENYFIPYFTVELYKNNNIMDVELLKEIFIRLNSLHKNHKNLVKSKHEKVVLIKGQSQYDVLRKATDYIKDELISIGYKVDVIDLMESNYIEQLNKSFSEKCDFVFSYNCIGIDFKVNGINLYDYLNVPFIGFLVDHPINQFSRISEKINNAIFLCCDKENIGYIKKYFPEKKCSFMTLPGFKNKNINTSNFEDRPIDVLFAGTLINPSDIKISWKKYGEVTFKILNEIVERMLLKDIGELSGIVDNIVDNKYRLKVNSSLEFKAFLHSSVERYIRNYKRYMLIKKFDESNIKVHCYGNKSELDKLNINRNLIIHDQVNFEELLNLMSNSKIVLNISAQLSEGVSERVFSSMINGAVAVTDNNKFLEKNFENGKNIILYDSDKIDEAAKMVKNLLTNNDLLKKIAEEGKNSVEKQYSVGNMAINIISAKDKCVN